MGMTIDEAIKVLKTSVALGECYDAKEIAIDTMRKYQKIEALINSWELGLIDNIGHEISEVLENGKID